MIIARGFTDVYSASPHAGDDLTFACAPLRLPPANARLHADPALASYCSVNLLDKATCSLNTNSASVASCFISFSAEKFCLRIRGELWAKSRKNSWLVEKVARSAPRRVCW